LIVEFTGSIVWRFRRQSLDLASAWGSAGVAAALALLTDDVLISEDGDAERSKAWRQASSTVADRQSLGRDHGFAPWGWRMADHAHPLVFTRGAL